MDNTDSSLSTRYWVTAAIVAVVVILGAILWSTSQVPGTPNTGADATQQQQSAQTQYMGTSSDSSSNGLGY